MTLEGGIQKIQDTQGVRMHGSGSVQVMWKNVDLINGVEVLILSEAHIYLLNNDGSS